VLLRGRIEGGGMGMQRTKAKKRAGVEGVGLQKKRKRAVRELPGQVAKALVALVLAMGEVMELRQRRKVVLLIWTMRARLVRVQVLGRLECLVPLVCWERLL
jgi:hypothetical protein